MAGCDMWSTPFLISVNFFLLMSTYQRVLVSIHKNNGVTKLAKFTECILTSLGFKENNGMVRCKLRKCSHRIWTYCKGWLLKRIIQRKVDFKKSLELLCLVLFAGTCYGGLKFRCQKLNSFYLLQYNKIQLKSHLLLYICTKCFISLLHDNPQQLYKSRRTYGSKTW